MVQVEAEEYKNLLDQRESGWTKNDNSEWKPKVNLSPFGNC